MKKLLLTAVATMVCVGVFAQGKLAFVNGNNSLVYFSANKTNLVAADANKTVGGFSLAGSSMYTGAGSTVASLAGSPTFVARLFGGATSSSLSLQTVGTMGIIDFAGLINPQVNVTLPSLPAGTPAWFRIDIVDSHYQTAEDAWLAGGVYAGTSGLFQATPQVSVYSPIWQTTAPVNSTLPGGTFVPLDYVGFPGYFGSIEMRATIIPEPGTFALAGLGLAALLAFRRRS